MTQVVCVCVCVLKPAARLVCPPTLPHPHPEGNPYPKSLSVGGVASKHVGVTSSESEGVMWLFNWRTDYQFSPTPLLQTMLGNGRSILV